MRQFKTTMNIVVKASLVSMAVWVALVSSPSSAQGPAISKLAGDWISVTEGSSADRLIIRRDELILITGREITHGLLRHEGGERFSYTIDFVDSEPYNKTENIRLSVSGHKLAFRKGEKIEHYSRFFLKKTGGKYVKRKGFSFKIPPGWVSNVELAIRKTGEKPEKYHMDQLVRYYEAGLEKPTEDMTIRLLDKPVEILKSELEGKMSNPAIKSTMSRLQAGGRQGYVFENFIDFGRRGITAKVYILPLNKAQTLVIAVPTLLPVFPFDLDRDCRYVLNSAR